MVNGIRLKGKIAPYAKKLRGIAHPHRLAIMYLLANDPLWVRDLVQKIGIPQSLMAHHLKAMEKTGWVRKSRDGRHMLYALQKKAFKEMMRLLSDTPFWRSLSLSTKPLEPILSKIHNSCWRQEKRGKGEK